LLPIGSSRHAVSEAILNMKTYCIILILLLGASAPAHAQQQAPRQLQSKPVAWVKFASGLPDTFFRTAEARRIGGNVLLYQQITGGWPKNIDMAATLTDSMRQAATALQRDNDATTIDNGATTTETTYLARLYGATGDTACRQAVLRGIGYLLRAQQESGGWPQFYPRARGYYVQITYNDDAMVHVMNLMRDVAQRTPPYAFVPDTLAKRCLAAFDRGLQCILNTQVRRGDTLTVWCAQHDRHTLLPCKARAYELPSLSGSESVGIVMLLMSLPHPSEAVRNAVEGAVAWFRASALSHLKREAFRDDRGRPDFRMVHADGDEPLLWARFYDLRTNAPFFCDRDGVAKPSVEQIGYERRNGYSWYSPSGARVLRQYEIWKKHL
jgi:PelA/Pel-15E family pectate lyase